MDFETKGEEDLGTLTWENVCELETERDLNINKFKTHFEITCPMCESEKIPTECPSCGSNLLLTLPEEAIRFEEGERKETATLECGECGFMVEIPIKIETERRELEGI